MHADAAEATRIPTGTPVVAGTVDAYSEAFSVGVRHPGDLMLMYGSTMFLVQIIDEYYTDPALWTTTGVEPGTLALAAGTSTAGSLIELAADHYRRRIVRGPDGRRHKPCHRAAKDC